MAGRVGGVVTGELVQGVVFPWDIDTVSAGLGGEDGPYEVRFGISGPPDPESPRIVQKYRQSIPKIVGLTLNGPFEIGVGGGLRAASLLVKLMKTTACFCLPCWFVPVRSF